MFAVSLIILLLGVIIIIQGGEGGPLDNDTSGPGGDNEPEEQGVVFTENSVTYLYVDASGDADCSLTDQISDSKLAEIIRFSFQSLGEEKAEQLYAEALRKNLIRYGMETESMKCEINGVEGSGPIVITNEWEISNYARRVENHWSISYEWVDNLAAARGVLAEKKDTWVLVRNTAQSSDISDVKYQITSLAHVVLPKGSENVQYFDQSKDIVTSYGGGTYEKSSLDLKMVEGRPHIIENTISVISGENKITVTVENLLTAHHPYQISYQKEPENWGFLDSIDEVRLSLKYGYKPKKNYLISGMEGNEYRLPLEEIFYCTAEKIITIGESEEFSIEIPRSGEVLDWGRTDWEACWEWISREEYVNLAREVVEAWNVGGEIRGPVGTSIGNIGIGDLVYTFTRVLDSYEEEGDLPEKIKFAPSLSWDLSLNGEKISSETAYYLLPEPDVITKTPTVGNIVNEVRASCESRSELPEKLLEWTNKEITYTIYSFGATSEEILKSKEGKCADFANVYLTLLRSAGIPARRVTGWVSYDPDTWSPPKELEYVVGETPEGMPIAGHAWTEVFLPELRWAPADPTVGQFENLPYNIYLPTRQSWIDVLGAYESVYGPL